MRFEPKFQASQREDSYEETIRDLTQRLKDVSALLSHYINHTLYIDSFLSLKVLKPVFLLISVWIKKIWKYKRWNSVVSSVIIIFYYQSLQTSAIASKLLMW